MSQLDLRLLRYFVAVTETGHVGLAAERLGISQSPLSRQLKVLEGELGLALFDRRGKRLHLSDAGRRFLPEALKLLKEAKRVQRFAGSLARGESGRLAIGYVRNALIDGRLALALRTFNRRHPEIAIEFHNRHSSLQNELLIRREIDVGFAHWPIVDPRVASERIVHDPFLLAAPAGHPVLAKASIEPRDLDGSPWIVIDRKFDPTAHDQLAMACKTAGFSPDIRTEAPDLQVSLQIVAAGLGFTFVPSAAINPHPDLIELRKLPWQTFALSIYMTRLNGHSTPQIEEFASLVRSRFRARKSRSLAHGQGS